MGTRSTSTRRPTRRSHHRRRRRRARLVAAALGVILGLGGGPAQAVGAMGAINQPLAVPTIHGGAHTAPLSQPAVVVLGAAPSLTFREPVGAAITDGWRPPSSPYGPGNRGWEYGTAEGDPVRSAGAGTVTFAGQVGGVGAVTVTHRGGLRTSYTRLASIDTRSGDRVIVGDRLGTAMTEMHFGVRIGDAYVDPGVLFRPGALRYGAKLRPL